MPFATGNGSTSFGGQWTYTCIAGYEIESGVNQISFDCEIPGKLWYMYG